MKKKCLQSTRGQGLVEYLILLGLISVSSIAIVSVVGKNVREQYARISNALRGKKEQIQLSTPDQSSYQSRGMDDFDQSANKQQ